MNQNALTPLEIYKVLPKTNCGRCLLPTCLAFSAAIVAGQKKMTDCPFLPEQDVKHLSGRLVQRSQMETGQDKIVEKLQEKITGVDLAAVAPVVGAGYKDNLLTINSMGKAFQIDNQGQVTSECHVMPGVKIPLLAYITNEKHHDITGKWISFRELGDATELHALFNKRCEKVLQQLADDNPDLLSDIIDLFIGRPTNEFQADIGLILHPLPHFPLLICYQAPEDGIGSELNIFFDECCSVNLDIQSTFTMCVGLVMMFDKISKLHV